MTINDSAISEQGMCEEEQVARIAWFYYHDGLTQSEISDRLGLTRLKVSRLLEKGHQSGIIRVQINSRFEGCLEYETQLRRQFSLQHVRVIPGLADADVGGRLGIGAAHMLMSLLQPQQMLAIGFWRGNHEYAATLKWFYFVTANSPGHALRWRRFLYDGYRAA
ncbi:putative sugar-binding regulatory protein [Escherichia coli]|nr:putative sugar-binding regulatory protein [Escherichia coli]